MTPEIFTSTPIEAHIVALFLKAQMTVAAVITGTAAFRVLLFGVLAWTICLQFLKISWHKHHAGEALVKIIYRVGMVFLALAFLGKGSSTTFSSTQGPWGNRPGVQASQQFSKTLGSNSEGLSWYLLIYRALNGLSQAMVNTTATVFSDDALKRDPGFLVKQLARMSLMSLSADTARAYESLLRDCSDGPTGKVMSPYTSVKELVDFSKADCVTRWTNFQAAVSAEGETLMNKYPAAIQEQMMSEMAARFPSLSIPSAQATKNTAVSMAFAKYNEDRAGFSGVGGFNSAANAAATMSTTGDRVMEEVGQGPMALLTGVADKVVSPFGINVRGKAQKAEAANKFNEFAALIPTTRGFMQGILALLFVFAAYSVGFGTWKFMYAWVLALATLSLYRPVAVLGYKVAEYFTTQSQMTEALTKISEDPLVVGGARILQNQLSRIQTVYLCFEIGAFAVFAIGAIACFKPVAAMTNSYGSAVVAGAASVLKTVGGAIAGGGVGGAAGGASSGAQAAGQAGVQQVNVTALAGQSGGGGGQQQGWGGQGGTGMITPSAPPPSTWKNVG